MSNRIIDSPGMRPGFGKRGTPMAVALGISIFAAFAGMYFVDRDVKKHEGHDSPYEHNGQAAMTSSEVSAAVSIPKPHDPRRHVHPIPAAATDVGWK